MISEKTKEKMVCTQEEFEKLLVDNQNFPYDVVNKEFSKYPWDVKEDLKAAAVEGMVYAATKYDPKRKDECKFISYAVHWIRWYINDEIRKLYPIKFNQSFIGKRKIVMKFINDYKNSHDGNEPSTEEIAKNVNMSEKVVTNILNVNNGENFQFLSFNAPSEADKDGNESEEKTSNKLVKEYIENEADGDDIFLKLEVKDLLEELKKHVNKNDYDIFYDYYINGENISDIAKKYKLRFPSSAAYLIKKCTAKCKEILSAE